MYSGNEPSENKINETISFIMASKRIKQLGINLPKKYKTCTLQSTKYLWKKLMKSKINGLEDLLGSR